MGSVYVYRKYSNSQLFVVVKDAFKNVAREATKPATPEPKPSLSQKINEGVSKTFNATTSLVSFVLNLAKVAIVFVVVLIVYKFYVFMRAPVL